MGIISEQKSELEESKEREPTEEAEPPTKVVDLIDSAIGGQTEKYQKFE